MPSTFPSPYEWSVIKHYEQEIRDIKRLDAREEKNIITALERARDEGKKAFPRKEIISTGEQAQKRLVEANLHLVILQLKRMAWNTIDLTTKDLIQEGNIGLIQAARYYNPQTGYAFSTFAMQCIHNAIVTVLKKDAKSQTRPHSSARIGSLGRQETQHEVITLLSYEIIAEVVGEKEDERAEEDINRIINKVGFHGIASEIIKELDDQERHLAESIFLRDITQGEYQAQHGISPKGMRKAKQKILQKAQHVLEKRGIKASDLFLH